MSRKTIIIGVIAILLIAGGIFFFLRKPSGKGMMLSTVQVTRGTISDMVTATGTVEPVIEVEVGTQVSGIIDKIYVDYNSTVKKGQLIAEMDKVTLQAEVDAAEAQLASNKAELDYQTRNYERYKELFEKQLIASSEYETAQYNYDRAKSAYDQSNASMVRVKQNLEYAIITSPIDGVVISKAVEEGQTVAAGFSTPTLFTIANDLTQMQVIANVDEADIGQVEESQHVTFTVDAYPNDIFEGDVTQVRLEATVESNVVTYEVVISAYNPDLKLKPGLTANVSIYTLERKDVLVIPSKALRFVPEPDLLSTMKIEVADPQAEAPRSERLVWQLQGNTLYANNITVGESSGGMTEVTGGLQEGEEIVVEMTTEAALPQNSTIERSPFMPGPRGSR
ncbi:MAG: efflux RND transporter periplasmic adaptor subunit [Tannerellaceae bacterium]|nr:efflux RND transporter periplasmic adaptor subunit [Tannerellaceae bacterium]